MLNGILETSYCFTGITTIPFNTSTNLFMYFQSVLREKKLLETKRLDLDACKNRLRKAKSAAVQQAVSTLLFTTNKWN